jgi:CheY-like chemotaxis protein
MKRVLVVDDQETLRLLVVDILESIDDTLSITEQENGALAIAELQQQDYDFMICDIKMPVMDGFEVVERLRTLSRNSTIPVILLTAEADPESIARGARLGATSYLTKPFNAEELTEAVKPYL